MNQTDRLNILFLESFYGGSHRYFADGLVRNSGHRYTLITLPARAWKWRIRTSALHFMEMVEDPSSYDLILVSDLINLADLKARWASRCPPIVVYFHENQLCYPDHPCQDPDPQFDVASLTTALSADHLLFNSSYHRDAFLEALSPVISRMPKPRPTWIPAEVERKSSVAYPGCVFPEKVAERTARESGPARILWNHRWEYDKKPEVFFSALAEVAKRGILFELIVLGGKYREPPQVFSRAAKEFSDRILHWGWVESKDEYFAWLSQADIAISTAIQENFGISAVESVRMGCYPLFPSRLSYPEILPENVHRTCLYRSTDQLITKLSTLCTLISSGNPHWRKPVETLGSSMERYAWPHLIDLYDDIFERIAENSHG